MFFNSGIAWLCTRAARLVACTTILRSWRGLFLCTVVPLAGKVDIPKSQRWDSLVLFSLWSCGLPGSFWRAPFSKSEGLRGLMEAGRCVAAGFTGGYF